jgi:magnesium transporter
MIAACAIYRPDGEDEPVPLEQVFTSALAPETFAWVDVTEPVQDDFTVFASEFDLHELAIEDAVEAGQRPKVERYGDTLVAVFRPARLDHSGSVVYDELFVAMGDQFVLTVAHGPLQAMLDEARRRMRATSRLENGPAAALHSIADVVVDGYVSLMAAKEHAFELAETSVFDTEQPARRIGRDLFRHKREVLQLWQAAAPLVDPLDALIDDRRGLVDDDVRQYLRDVSDHLKGVVSRLETHRDLLTDAFDVNVAQVGVKQNEDMRKMSAWAALLLLPTLLAGLWGMNFSSMPELDEPWGYPMALGVIALSCLALGIWFRRIKWL